MRITTPTTQICTFLLLIAPLAAQIPADADTQSNRVSVQPELVVSFGHSGSVLAVAFSPDGQTVLTGSQDNTARLWDAVTGAELRQFKGHTDSVTSVAFSPDGRTILTGSNDNTARVWDVLTGVEARRFEGHAGSVSSVAFSPDGTTILTGSWDRTVRSWNVATGAEMHQFPGHADRISAIALSPDGKYLFVRSFNAATRLWEVATGEMLGEINRCEQCRADYDVAFSPDGKFAFLTGGFEIAVIDMATGAELRRLENENTKGLEIAISPDGKTLLTGGTFSDAISVLDLATGTAVQRFEWDIAPFTSVSFSPDGQTVLTGSADHTARLWDVASGDELTRFEGQVWSADRATFSPDGQSILTIGWDDMARMWDVSAGAELGRFDAPPDYFSRYVYTVTFSPDGNTVLTAHKDGKVRLWDVATGAELQRINAYDDGVYALAASPDGRSILTSSDYRLDPLVRLWDLASGTELRRFEGHGAAILAIVFSRDGRTALTGSADNTARLWDVATGEELQRFNGHTNWLNSVALSADGQTALTGSGDRTARLWNVETGAELRRFEGHIGPITSVAFSPDSKKILTGSADNTARLWDAATGAELRSFEGHSGSVTSVEFSLDGRIILTGSQDSTARLWDATTGIELAQLVSFNDGTWAVVDTAGRFDASNGGNVDGLHWVAGFEVISLSQLKDRYYEPGLLAKVLGINEEPVRDVATLTDVELYPYVNLVSPSADSPSLQIDLRNRGGGLGQVVVAINGKEIAADARGKNFDENAVSASISIDLSGHPNIIPGVDNTIEVKVYNSEGYLVSRGLTVTWQAPGQIEAPKLWAVVAGVSDYDGEALDLNFAAKDAEVFAAALEHGARRLFGAEQVHLTILSTDSATADGPPTRENIVLALQELAAAKPTDVVLVYLAGHGVAHGGLNGDYYFLTQHATSTALNDPAVRATVALSSEELTELMLQIPVARKQVLILDTCGAGRVVERLNQSRGVPASQTRALDRMKDRTGLFVLAGSAADAVSYEASRYGQGLLTYSLLEGMRGASLRAEEYVDVSQWFGYAADRVQVMAADIGGVQRPLVGMPGGTGSFDVARMTATERSMIELQQPRPFIIRANFQLNGPPIDPLNLTLQVNSALRDASARGHTTPFVFVDTPVYEDGYQLSGRYTVNATTNEVVVSVYVLRENEVIGTKTVAGASSELNALIEDIIAVAADLL